jgi:hypothetical protein
MRNIEVRRLGNQVLAMGVATVLALYAIGVATSATAPVPAYATNYDDKHHDEKDKHDDKNKHHDEKDKHDDKNKHHDEKDKHYNNDNSYDNNDNHYSQFLMDVEQCFLDNGEQYSDEVEQCIYDVMAAYFDNDNNSEGSTSSSSSSTTTTNGNSNNDLVEGTGDMDDNNSEDIFSQM